MKSSLTHVKSFFPKILRFITEKGVLLVISFVSLFVLGAVVSQTLRLQESLKQAKVAKAQRLHLAKELAYWQGIVREYGDYRDAYFKIAILQYQLGERDLAKKSLEKVLALDPNYEKAKVLGTKISAK